MPVAAFDDAVVKLRRADALLADGRTAEASDRIQEAIVLLDDCTAAKNDEEIVTDGGRTHVAALDDDRTVYHAGNGDGPPSKIHLCRGCRFLVENADKVFDAPAGTLYDDRLVCTECLGTRDAGGVQKGVDPHETRQLLADLDADDIGSADANGVSTTQEAD
jgi:hypothetical protein